MGIVRKKGYTTANVAVTEEYDGTSWVNSNNMNTTRARVAGAGIQTSAIGFGGLTPANPAYTGVTEQYDGTSWANSTSLTTARRSAGGAGTTAAGIAFGGNAPPHTTATEEFTGADIPLVQTVTTS